MPITNGSRLGPYEIVSRIGAGGMGEVWRARDTRLDRSVAVKILTPELAGNAQLKVRFDREARAISQLNHPHICTLYDVGDDYLVMELLDGDTLAERLTRGPLPIADVLRYGAEIADALDRAHRAGIVHRDLKPGNIMITKSGAKLLDFGLAKAAREAVTGDAETMQKSITQEGTILGTFQYMAPEQLEGMQADARTDIFALGAVLYEMATGRRAFEGKTRTSVIAAIVASQPQPISSIQPVTPAAFEHVVQKCLEKEPDERWQSAHDVAEELRWVAKEGIPVAAANPRSNRWLGVAAIILGLAALASTALYVRELRRPQQPVAFAIGAPRGLNYSSHAISPDGRAVAMRLTDRRNIGGDGIWIRRLNEIHPVKLADSGPGQDAVFWSPDSVWIGYFDRGSMMRVNAAGGQPERITRDGGGGVGASWSPNGTILFAPRWGDGLFRVDASGGSAQRVTSLDPAKRETIHAWPQFLPDGEHFLHIVRTVAAEPNQIHARSLDGKISKVLTTADSLIGVSRGSLLYVRDGAIYAAPFDHESIEITGTPRQIIDGVAYFEEAAHAAATLARNGALLYIPVESVDTVNELVWVDRTGRTLETVIRDRGLQNARLSGDGKRVAVLKRDVRKGADDVYTLDLSRRILTKVTGTLASHLSAVWSRDGSEVFFASDRDGMYDLYAQSEDGTTPARTLWKNRQDKWIGSLTPDGSTLLVVQHDEKTLRDILAVPLNGEAPRAIVASDAREDDPAVSPDGRWLAYMSDRSGRNEIYVRRYPDGRSVQVSPEGGAVPAWRHDSSEIFFFSQNRIYAVPIGDSGGMPLIGTPTVLFDVPAAMTSTTPSPVDDRFLAILAPEPEDHVAAIHYRSSWE
jgi:Tol biopolymer transport system component